MVLVAGRKTLANFHIFCSLSAGAGETAAGELQKETAVMTVGHPTHSENRIAIIGVKVMGLKLIIRYCFEDILIFFFTSQSKKVENFLQK